MLIYSLLVHRHEWACWPIDPFRLNNIVRTEKDVFSSCYERGTRKNSVTPWGIEPETIGFRAPMLYHWATDSTVSEVYYEVHVTRVLYTVRVSNVDSVMLVDGTRKTVSFELGKEIEQDFFSSCHERETMKKFWGPMRNRTSDLRIPRSEHLHKNLTTKQQHNLCFWSNNQFFYSQSQNKHLCMSSRQRSTDKLSTSTNGS